jgi:hypothetical protein
MDRSVYGVMDMAGNVLEWVEAPLPQAMQNTAMTKGGSFANAAPYLFLCANRNAQPKGNGKVDYIGFRCARDVKPGESQQSNGPIKQVQGTKDSASDPSSEALRPKPQLYRTGLLQILPIYDLDPTQKTYRNDMAVYLSRSRESQEMLKQQVPWRIEIRASYLPGDRFACLFENHWTKAMQQAKFNDDFTSAELKSSIPNYMEVSIQLVGGPDYVDIVYNMKNTGQQEMYRGQETCFQTLWAPNFRDQDGTRTLISTDLSTDQGVRQLTEVRHRVWERLWAQDYDKQAKSPPNQGPNQSKEGPTVQGDLIMITSRDSNWVVAPLSLSGPPIRLVNNREYSCLHCNPFSALKPGELKRVKQRVYFLRGSPEDLVKRYRTDLENKTQPGG